MIVNIKISDTTKMISVRKSQVSAKLSRDSRDPKGCLGRGDIVSERLCHFTLDFLIGL